MCIHVYVFIYNLLVDVMKAEGAGEMEGGGDCLKRVVGRVRASRHYKVHPLPLLPFMEKTEKTACTDPSPWKRN